MGDIGELFNAQREATKQHRAAMLAKADTTGWTQHIRQGDHFTTAALCQSCHRLYGRIVCSDNPDAGELIGLYDDSVLLEDFRADVKFTARMRRKLERLA